MTLEKAYCFCSPEGILFLHPHMEKAEDKYRALQSFCKFNNLILRISNLIN